MGAAALRNTTAIFSERWPKPSAVSSITVLPRQAPDLLVLPERIEQTPARPGWIGYSVAALRTALLRPVDLIFCGHLFMAPLAALISATQGRKAHRADPWD